MNQQILDAIAKSLPAMQVEVLRAELDKAAQFESLQNTISNLKEERSALQKEVGLLRQLQLSEHAIKDREYKLELTLAKKELEYIQNSRHELKELMHAAFRNVHVHRRINGTGDGSNNGYTTREETTHHE